MAHAPLHSWLGMNSKQQRLSRAAVELQARMRLAASGSRFEVREQYLPYFVSRLTAPLVENGQVRRSGAGLSGRSLPCC
jgi:replication factor C subunit 1